MRISRWSAHTTATYITRLWQQHIFISMSNSLSVHQKMKFGAGSWVYSYASLMYTKGAKGNKSCKKERRSRRGFQVGSQPHHCSVHTHHNQCSVWEFRLWVQIFTAMGAVWLWISCWTSLVIVSSSGKWVVPIAFSSLACHEGIKLLPSPDCCLKVEYQNRITQNHTDRSLPFMLQSYYFLFNAIRKIYIYLYVWNWEDFYSYRVILDVRVHNPYFSVWQP